MGKHDMPPIRAAAYVRLNGELKVVEELTARQRTYLGTKLKERYLGELFAGRAVFAAMELPREEASEASAPEGGAASCCSRDDRRET